MQRTRAVGRERVEWSGAYVPCRLCSTPAWGGAASAARAGCCYVFVGANGRAWLGDAAITHGGRARELAGWFVQRAGGAVERVVYNARDAAAEASSRARRSDCDPGSRPAHGPPSKDAQLTAAGSEHESPSEQTTAAPGGVLQRDAPRAPSRIALPPLPFLHGGGRARLARIARLARSAQNRLREILRAA